MRMFHRFDKAPFIILSILIIVIYAFLIYYNWSLWRNQYYDEEVYKFRPLVYDKKVKIQEDKRKRFPERKDVFSPFTSITLDPIRRASSTAANRKCAIFEAFIYPLVEDASLLARRLYKQLILSRYTINDSKNACVLVAVLDNEDQLENLTYLKGREDDHIIYLLNGTLSNSNHSIRHLFSSDIFGSNGLLLDVEDEVRQKWQPQRPIYNAPRWLILQIHTDQYDKDSLTIGCEPKITSKDSKCIYTNALEDITRSQSTFIYIDYKDPRKFHTAFYLSFLSGAIPIISGYDLTMLGLNDLIEWNNVVIRAPTNQLHHLLDYLEQLDQSQLLEMRRKSHFYFMNYLSTAKVLIRSTLSAIRYRMQIPAPLERTVPAKLMGISKLPNNYRFKEPLNLQSPYTSLRNVRFVFNVDPTFLDTYSPYDRLWQTKWMSNTGPLISHWSDNNRGIKYSTKLNGNIYDEEFTIIINAYKRDEQLKRVLQNLNNLKFVRYVLVVWNDIERQPKANYFPSIHVPIHFILARNNSLNERFKPFDLIETEAVFSMDDDFEASPEQIEFAFRVWRENRDVLVGPNERLGYTDPITMRGIYKTETECRYNIILTSGAFFHRNYLFAYWNTMPSAIREWVDKVTNCEDIAMNFLIAHLSRKQAIKVTSIFRTSGSFTNGVGLSKKQEHKWNREKCLQVFEEIYGYNPLLLSEYRIDSTHYNHESKYQCFKNT